MFLGHAAVSKNYAKIVSEELDKEVDKYIN